MKKPNQDLFVEPLSETDFNNMLDTIITRIRETLQIKASEYVRNNDRMHNFNRASMKKGVIREIALDGMRLKHEVSIDDMINDLKLGITPDIKTVDEKLGDRLNYDILEEISLRHRLLIKNKN